MRVRITAVIIGVALALSGLLCAGRCESLSAASIYDLYAFDWLGAVKVVWKATIPEGGEAVFEIYRSEAREGPYGLIQEIGSKDPEFVDPLTGNYIFFDRKVKRDRFYYYQVRLQGTNMVLGPARGLARSGPPGT